MTIITSTNSTRKARKKELHHHQNLLDEQVSALLRQVTVTVEEFDNPHYFVEWQAAYFRWVTAIQARISDLSLDHLEGHILDNHIAEDGTYWSDPQELKDAQKLQSHISK
jgi:hypothetical protein